MRTYHCLSYVITENLLAVSRRLKTSVKAMFCQALHGVMRFSIELCCWYL